MKIKRLFASISGQLDDLVTSVENHEAVAESAIKEVRQQTARINAQLQQNRHRVDQLQQREQKLEQQIELWKDRAKRSADANRAQALRCLSAMKNCEKESAQVVQQRQQAQDLANELQNHLHEAEQHMLALQSKKDSLVARAARNKIVASAPFQASTTEDTNAVFMRWEEKVIAGEYTTPPAATPDQSLDSQFKKQEDQETLEAELDLLLAPQTKAKSTTEQGEEQ